MPVNKVSIRNWVEEIVGSILSSLPFSFVSFSPQSWKTINMLQSQLDELLSKEGSSPNQQDLEELLVGVKPKLDSQVSRLLDRKFTAEEVRIATFDIGPTKAHGKDGLPTLFYQKFWDSVGYSMVLFCLKVLNEGVAVDEMNSIVIALIPKSLNLKSLADYRPISLCNVLYKIIAKAITNRVEQDKGTISGFKCSRGEISISHLFFTNDSLLFTKAHGENCATIQKILEKYSKASGQVVKFDKSVICVSPSISVCEGERLVALIGVNIVDCHEKYLGLPCFMGRSKRKIYTDIIDRVWRKIKGWGEKLLSVGGKEILIKAVIQAIPMYSMSFRNLEISNCALFASQCWRILKNPDSLAARILKGCYYKDCGLLDAPNNPRLLQQHFLPEYVEAILKIPTGPSGSADTMLWHYEGNERYNVKSGYWLGCKMVEESDSTLHALWNCKKLKAKG
ncbi:hypothetical protein Ddye_026613 [Dipteronia dyeriana]|uniref:Reverse transcriptase domain-containing protein n=1 Tax=Dipteronia dyeriana TaxID=168575 RepID=A0AAD9TN08_9ROSI|nr:hypothetical protein Ddye_026613 [Dipteronia dyeriana]